MAVDLGDYTESLLREVNPPGQAVVAASDDELIGYLADAFWEASLDGFLAPWTCDEDGLVTPTATGGADITRAEVALIILYASIKMLRNRILNINTTFRAKAGTVEFEQQNSAIVLQEMLKQLRATKDQLLKQSLNTASLDVIYDALSTRTYSGLSYWGGPELSGM
jgi:hypothetical protein